MRRRDNGTLRGCANAVPSVGIMTVAEYGLWRHETERRDSGRLRRGRGNSGPERGEERGIETRAPERGTGDEAPATWDLFDAHPSRTGDTLGETTG